jgi:hypothetical protein
MAAIEICSAIFGGREAGIDLRSTFFDPFKASFSGFNRIAR